MYNTSFLKNPHLPANITDAENRPFCGYYSPERYRELSNQYAIINIKANG